MRWLLAVFLIGALSLSGCQQSLTPIPHAELEAMLNQAAAVAADYDEVVINGFGIHCNPPACDTAFMTLDRPAPAYEAAVTDRFGGRIVFRYGRPVWI
jgi:hypothetical protein